MASPERLVVCLGLLMLAGVGMASLPMDDNAKKLLLRSMDRAYEVNVSAIVDQRCLEDGVIERLRVRQSFDGRSRYDVLAPFACKGIESFDDGSETTTFVPGSHVVMVQASLRKVSCRPADRLALAEMNYRLTREASARVAGRDTVCVQAVPIHQSLPTRRYYLDAQTGYLLRSEVVTSKGKETRLNTVSISYPKKISVDEVKVHAAGENLIRYSRHWEEPARDSSAIGFKPIVPAGLPLGFVIQDVKLSKSQEWTAVIIRISDGLVQGSVYEWKPSGRGSDGVHDALDRTVTSAYGVRLLLIADIPVEARQEILRAFKESKAHAWLDPGNLMEPSGTAQTLAVFGSRRVEFGANGCCSVKIRFRAPSVI